MTLSHDEIIAKAKAIKLAIFDVDGVLTDGKLTFSSDGQELKSFSTIDGLGLKLLRQSGVELAIISARTTPAVTQRAHELGIRYLYQNQHDKRQSYAALLEQLKLNHDQVCYTGDDLPDLPLIRQCGLGIAVANACEYVQQHADYITKACGGQGAVREICELIMRAQGTLTSIYEQFL